MKLCKDCKFCDQWGYDKASCKHPKAIVSKDVATGGLRIYRCEWMRNCFVKKNQKTANKNGYCKLEAVLFEPKKRWWNFKKYICK